MALGDAVAATVGDNCLDVYLPPVGATLVGGSCLNVAIGLRAHGLGTAYLGAVGDDAGGRLVREALGRHGVGADGLRVVPGASTAVTELASKAGGERRIVREEYAVNDAYAPDEGEWEWLGGRRLVHASRTPGGLERLLALGRRGVAVAYDFAYDPPPDDLRGLDVAFAPQDALAPGTEAEDAASDLRERGAACAVVTRGAQGALARDNGGLERVPAAPIERVVDTCGAGDAFIAAFLAARLGGASTADALAAGARAGGAACCHLGAFPQAELRVGAVR